MRNYNKLETLLGCISSVQYRIRELQNYEAQLQAMYEKELEAQTQENEQEDFPL